MTTSVHPSKVRELFAYRTIDLITLATLGVAFGIVFWGWDRLYYGAKLTSLLSYPPSVGLLAGPWLLAAVVGGLIIRKPGAALAAEFVAANVEYILPGNEWGTGVLVSGLLQGLGVEIVLALFLYRRFDLGVAVLGAILAATVESVYEWDAYWATTFTTATQRWAYLGSFALSGAVIAGLGGWLLTRALARTGALDSFAPGREATVEV